MFPRLCLGYSSLFRGFRCAHKAKTFLRFFDNWGRMFLCLVGSMHASIHKPFFIQFHAFYFILFFCVKLAKCRTSSGFTPPPNGKPGSATSIRFLLNLRSHCSLLRIRGWEPKKRNRALISLVKLNSHCGCHQLNLCVL